MNTIMTYRKRSIIIYQVNANYLIMTKWKHLKCCLWRPTRKWCNITETTGKVVLLKHIHNINTGIRPKLDSAAEMINLSSWLDCRTDVFVQYVTDTANKVQDIFIQDETMKKLFEQSPEVILVDATYKTNDLRMPLYLMLVIDSNGESEIVAAFVVLKRHLFTP